MGNSASELYQGEGGKLYWERNRLLPEDRNKATNRAHAIRSLYHHAEFLPRLEIGCGQRWNMYPWDIGQDIDPRNKPHMVLDARNGLPFTDQSFPVVFCVGLLMHLPWNEDRCGMGARYVLHEMARVASKAVIIGEYIADIECDLLWDYHNGSFGTGEPGLVWERPYEAPQGYINAKQTKLIEFGDKPTFLVFERKA